MAMIVAETAARLVATPGKGETVDRKRRLGRALFGSEVLGFAKDEEQHVAGTQDLVVRLGLYDEDDFDVIDKDLFRYQPAGGGRQPQRSVVMSELSATLGGYEDAVDVELVMIDEVDSNWMLAHYDNPLPGTTERLDKVVRSLPRRFRSTSFTRSELLLLARHIRYRLSVDHGRDACPDVLFWRTPVVDEWLETTGTSWGEFRKADLWRARGPSPAREIGGKGADSDDAQASMDDWGDIDIHADPLRVGLLGPRSQHADTHEDVMRVLDRAGDLLDVVKPKQYSVGGDSRSYQPQINALEKLRTAGIGKLRPKDLDVLILYRGGGVDQDDVRTEQERELLLREVEKLAAHGVEVVIGIGHGTDHALPVAQTLPIGVYEATTPTAAAEWALREFVNSRLVNTAYDPGQRG